MNQRAIATTAIWLVMPCPEKRSAKITKNNPHQTGLNAIARQASAVSTKTAGASTRTRNRSVSPPAQTIASAETKVPTV